MDGAIVLASASPRRRELLARAGLVFDVRPADVEEGLGAFASPADAAVLLAERKARAAAGALADSDGPRWVVGADTVVALRPGPGAPWELFGKPAGPAEARAMLTRLGGSRHVVATGVAVVALAPGGAVGAVATDVEETLVTMRPLAPGEVEAYVASGEWRDKAGGYAIQDTADAFVERLEGGGFDNVVGLPVARTLRLLRAAGAPVPDGPAPATGRPDA